MTEATPRAVPRAVHYALASNVAVAACKYAAAIYTNSGSAYAEAIHSSADCANQLLLITGRRVAGARADDQHPLGFGRATYFYSMLVAVQVFIGGGLASIAIGVYRLVHHSVLDHPYVVLAVLCASGLIEGLALRASIRSINPLRRRHGLYRWFRDTGEPEVLLSVGEDFAALAGIVLSMCATGLSVLTGRPVFDSCGGIAVGLLLMGSAVSAMREIQSLIIGEAAHRHVREAMLRWLDARAEIERVVSLVVLRWADDLVVSVQAELTRHDDAEELVRDRQDRACAPRRVPCGEVDLFRARAARTWHAPVVMAGCVPPGDSSLQTWAPHAGASCGIPAIAIMGTAVARQ